MKIISPPSEEPISLQEARAHLRLESGEDDSSQQTMQGPSGMRSAIYLISIWADTRRDAMAVARQVRFALDGYRGAFKDIPVTGAFLDNMARERDSDTEAYFVSMRFTINYQESL